MKASSGYAKPIAQTSKYWITGLLAVDAGHDLVLLAVDAHAAPLVMGDSSRMAVGDAIFAVGNPKGLEGTFSEGILSGVRQFGSDRLFQITAPISPGSSGGPVLNQSGSVIGIAEGTITGGQNLNFAIPVSYLKQMLEKPTKPTALAANRASSRESPLFGSRTAEGVVGEKLAWDDADVMQLKNPFIKPQGKYSFTMRNTLRSSIRNVYCVVVFSDVNKTPIDIDVIHYEGIIPAGLAKRVSGTVDPSVETLTRWLEFRVLDFEIVD